MTQESRAMVFLTVVAATTVVWFVSLFFRRPHAPDKWLLYYVDRLLASFMWRMDYPNRRLPPNKSVVLIANHRSAVDPCLIQAVIGARVCHWMVAYIYTRNPLLAWVFKVLEIIPVKTSGNDSSPIKKAIRLAQNGELVGIFPEGRINRTDEFMLSVRPGAVMVALKAEVQIVPCYLEGSPYNDVHWRSLLTPSRVKLKMGPPIDLSDFYGRHREKELVDWLTAFCVKEIAKLAGRPDYEPKFAGRKWKAWQEL